jgi:hypothetical protein
MTLSDEARVEGLTVAMALAPGVYTRNRMFAFFTQDYVMRARTRASVLRGIVPQLGRATNLSLTSEARGDGHVFVLRYAVTTLRLTRVVELTPVELSALRVLGGRAGLVALPPDESDRVVVERALAKLIVPDDSQSTADLARVARDSVLPPV